MPLDYKQFPPMGACIYCGATDGLTREHIIPLGLGGTGVLPQASCHQCAVATSKYERTVLRGPLWAIRAHLKLKSRRPRAAPSRLPLKIVRNGNRETVELALADHPLLAFFPHFNAPTYLVGEHTHGITVSGVSVNAFGKPIRDVAHDLGTSKIAVTQEYHYVPFAQMIGKIGWAMAAATGMLKKIDSSIGVLESLIDRPNDIGRWVGTLTDPPQKHENILHRIDLRENSDQGLMCADVQLFASAQTPSYGVILGALR